ncbi:protein mono-ADP-ribosyltransferase PARP15-like isoform X2 [Synchiropus splendidus]|uniref:protein mono-ADP-ribosyltransferase PARP15-like isoform X2 n=1 Tax=Synchiropus splendidus TaxID=270530 RepID=UPI00237E2F50|nr:protein mono-ADP-ribosyltransferase PARP15-like isoform X2 [Synchiropus splendidus]
MSFLFYPLKAIRNMLPASVDLNRFPEENWAIEKSWTESALFDSLPAKASTALKNLLAAHGLPENLEPFIEVGEKLEKLMQELERLWVDHCPFPNSYPQLAVENLQPTQGSKSEPALYHWLVYIALFRTVWEKIQQNLKRYGDLPPHWNDMSFDLVKVCPVSPESTEYKHLTYRLKHQGFTRRPISIERVQNKTLWKSYQLKKKELEEKNYSQSNEKILFHGTKANFIPNINRRGFNRSYAGMQGAKYGKGSYFSVNPNYAREFCGPDENGVKRMYIVRVLVGAFTLGRADIIAPPPTNHEAGDLFDSVVDTLERPTMYITFNDIQAYPEYLISFM